MNRRLLLAALIPTILAFATASPVSASVAPGPSTTSEDVWLHYDYMVGSDGHSDAPPLAAIHAVADVFAAHGIELHIDKAHAVIPEHPAIAPDFTASLYCPNDLGFTDIASFSQLKATYFHPAQKHEWHYAIFGSWTPCGATGAADLPGDNLLVSEGRLQYIAGGSTDFLVRDTSGTFMHELGHNLGLHHGGGDDINGKPNYLSVMSYSFQFPTLPVAATPGSTAITGYRLDYSEVALPTLDENHLDEAAGIGGGAGDVHITTYDTVYGFGFGAAAGPIDWNLDGQIEHDVAVNLNLTDDCYAWGFFNCDNSVMRESFRGFNDWAEVHAYLAAGEPHQNHRAVLERA